MTSTWFEGGKRSEWVRPCVKDKKLVVFADSMGKVFGRMRIIIPEVSFTSYSGMDVSFFYDK